MELHSVEASALPPRASPDGHHVEPFSGVSGRSENLSGHLIAERCPEAHESPSGLSHGRDRGTITTGIGHARGVLEARRVTISRRRSLIGLPMHALRGPGGARRLPGFAGGLAGTAAAGTLFTQTCIINAMASASGLFTCSVRGPAGWPWRTTPREDVRPVHRRIRRLCAPRTGAARGAAPKKVAPAAAASKSDAILVVDKLLKYRPLFEP